MMFTPLLQVQAAGMMLFDEAWACPDCPTAQAVRAVVFGEGFWMNLGLIGLPLLVLGGICALLYRVGLSRAAASSAAEQKEVEP